MYFRPGDGQRMIARCQFGVHSDGRSGATLTYPIPGYPWRRNPSRSYEFAIDPTTIATLFTEVLGMPAVCPDACLSDDLLWSDHSEKANAITRDRLTDTPCVTIGLYDERGTHTIYFSMRENSPELLHSQIHSIVTRLVAPYETLADPQSRQPASPHYLPWATTQPNQGQTRRCTQRGGALV